MEIKEQSLQSGNWIAQRLGSDGQELDLLKLWRIVWNRKWRIVLLTLLSVFIAALVVYSLKPVYRATATLLVTPQKSSNVVAIEQVYNFEGRGSEFLQTQFQLLRSRSLAERVVKDLNLIEHPEFAVREAGEAEGVVVSLKRLLFSLASPVMPTEAERDGEPAQPVSRTEAVTTALMDRITVEPQGRTQIVLISVDMNDAKAAAEIANALANGFIQMQLDAAMQATSSATQWMNTRLEELKISLKESEDRLQEFREKENLVDVDGVATISAAELSATSDRMIDARRQRAEAESLYRQVASSRAAGLDKLASIPAILSDPLVQQFKTSEAQARSKVDEMSRRYGARHPNMEAANTELAAARASLRSQIEQVVAGIERNYQLALANEGALKASVDANKSQIQHISRKEFKLRELQREVDANRSLYDTFMTRLKETAVTADLDASNARVVDLAVVPKVAIKPKKGLVISLAAFGAFVFVTALVLLFGILDNTFKAGHEIEEKLNLPALGILPKSDERKSEKVAKLFHDNLDRRFSESVRTIRTSIMLSRMTMERKVILVTSSVPGEGKSTVAANLAYAMGQTERVLLIDGDMRKPTLAHNFDFPVGAPGLANLLAGTAKLEDCVRQVDGVDLMCAGIVPPSPLELLSSPRFAKLLEYLTSRYDTIVIDSPPLHAVSDAVLLSTHAQGVIYVVRYGKTPIPQVSAGIGMLLQHNAPLVGVVLNQVDIKRSIREGYSHTGHYDYYGYSEDSAKS